MDNATNIHEHSIVLVVLANVSWFGILSCGSKEVQTRFSSDDMSLGSFSREDKGVQNSCPSHDTLGTLSFENKKA